MNKHLIRSAQVAAALGVAILTGVAVAFSAALLGHELLVMVYGDDLSVIDNTLPMIATVWTSYVVGILAGLIVLVVCWRRFVRGPRPVAD